MWKYTVGVIFITSFIILAIAFGIRITQEERGPQNSDGQTVKLTSTPNHFEYLIKNGVKIYPGYVEFSDDSTYLTLVGKIANYSTIDGQYLLIVDFGTNEQDQKFLAFALAKRFFKRSQTGNAFHPVPDEFVTTEIKQDNMANELTSMVGRITKINVLLKQPDLSAEAKAKLDEVSKQLFEEYGKYWNCNAKFGQAMIARTHDYGCYPLISDAYVLEN